MKKDKFDGRGAEECKELDWVDLSESLNAQDGIITQTDNEWDIPVVDETKSRIDAENLRVDTSDFGEVNEAVKDIDVASDQEQAIRKSVDEKIIIRSKELKDKREGNKKSSKNSKNSKSSKASGNTGKEKEEPVVNYRTQKGLDKYRKMGVLPTKTDGPTQFRKESANWRDEETPKAEVTDEAIAFDEENESFLDKIKSFTAVDWIAVAMAVVIFLTSVMTTGVYADYRGVVNKETAFANLPGLTVAEEDYSEGEIFDLSGDEDDPTHFSLFGDEDVPLEESASGQMLSLVLTSVEKDLKIKLIDEEDTLVKGIAWGVTVTDKDDNSESFDDEDKDGIIHLTDIKAGEYTVSINESDSLEGYIFPTIGQQVSVKAKIEYKVIANIKDEIKKESEVNAAIEDNGNQAADIETGTAPADTVEFVESTQIADEEEYEEAEVDLSNTEIIASIGHKIVAALSTFARSLRSTYAGPSVGTLALGFNPVTSGFGARKVASEELTPDDVMKQVEDLMKEIEEVQDNIDPSGLLPNYEVPTPTPTPTLTPTPTPTPTGEPADQKKVETVNLDKSSVNIEVGSSVSLSYSYSPADAKIDKIEWKSQDSSIASISDGKIKGEKAGTTKVGIIINDSVYAAVDVTVVEPSGEGSVVLSGPNTVFVGKTISLEAKVTPETDFIETWYTANNEIASVYSNGNSVTIGGISEGKTVITAQSARGIKATFDVTVTSEGAFKDEAQLYDSAKNKLYVLDNGQYRLAKYIDYKSGNFAKFYRKVSDTLYTGWQVIDGVTYYFTEDHEKVTGDQVIGGVSYHFAPDGALDKGSGVLGIDVSKYQPSINWSSVKASGVNFVIIRCGYRGASTGALIQDPYFTSHIRGAKDAGLKVGVYFFSTALNEAEAVEEASMCAALCEGYGINYPIFLDVESSSRPGYNSLSVDQRTANIRAFCSTISSAGYAPGLYANKTWLTEKISPESLSCKIWLAQYNAGGPTYTGHYDIWQYTSKGSVNGISGNVDMNKSYLSY